MILGGVKMALGPEYDVGKHFTPRYNPWEQRLCLVPDHDLFDAIREGRADLVALYYIMDPLLVEIGVMPSLDVGRAGLEDDRGPAREEPALELRVHSVVAANLRRQLVLGDDEADLGQSEDLDLVEQNCRGAIRSLEAAGLTHTSPAFTALALMR